jgi:hypothetical protein
METPTWASRTSQRVALRWIAWSQFHSVVISAFEMWFSAGIVPSVKPFTFSCRLAGWLRSVIASGGTRR